jgi:hypothetical protein
MLTSGDVTVTQNPLPNPLVSFDGSYMRTQTYFVTYQWYYNGSVIPGATSSSMHAIANGNYKVAVTDTNGCQSMSDIYILSNYTGGTGVGVKNVNLDQQIRIYPNPAANTVHIESPVTVRTAISSIDGKVLISKTSDNIDISGLADGVYIMRIYDENGTAVKTEKLVKVSN